MLNFTQNWHSKTKDFIMKFQNMKTFKPILPYNLESQFIFK